MKKLILLTSLLAISLCRAADDNETWNRILEEAEMYTPGRIESTAFHNELAHIPHIPQMIRNMPLTKIILKGKPITALPQAELPQLQWLTLENNQIKDINDLHLSNARFPRLKGLLLEGNQISAIPAQLRLNALEGLNLSNNQISHVAPTILEQFPKLNTLILSGNKDLPKEDIDELKEAARKAERNIQIVADDIGQYGETYAEGLKPAKRP